MNALTPITSPRGYTIYRTADTMTICDNDTEVERAEYRLTPGLELEEMQDMARAIDAHIDDGGTMGNYQW